MIGPGVEPGVDQEDIPVAVLKDFNGADDDVLTFAQFKFSAGEDDEAVLEKLAGLGG